MMLAIIVLAIILVIIFPLAVIGAMFLKGAIGWWSGR